MPRPRPGTRSRWDASFAPGSVLLRRPRGLRLKRPPLLRKRTSGRRAHPARLRAALDKLGRVYECDTCGNPGLWMGEVLGLELDHIDGDVLNNEASNLRYLCPNCHRITPTWGT